MTEFYWSTTQEGFANGPFASRADAVVAALTENLNPGQEFFTCVRKDVTGADFLIDERDVLERLGEIAYEMAGEAAEGWPADDDAPDLAAALNRVLVEWIDKNDPPSFWVADQEERHAGLASGQDWGRAQKHLERTEKVYAELLGQPGVNVVFALGIVAGLRRRFDVGERTDMLYRSIMDLE